MLITPLLFVTGVRPQIAVGTSLAALTMLSCIGFSAHLLLDGIALGLVPIVAAVLGGAVGSMIGSNMLARLTPHWMLMLFAIVQTLVAGRRYGPMRLSVCSPESSPASSVSVAADSSCYGHHAGPQGVGRRQECRERRRRVGVTHECGSKAGSVASFALVAPTIAAALRAACAAWPRLAGYQSAAAQRAAAAH